MHGIVLEPHSSAIISVAVASSSCPTISPKKPYRVGRSRTGLGLFATKRIKKGTKIVRYFGPLLDSKKKKDDAIENKYLFELNNRWTIDGSVRENVARYINHACKPNAESDVRPRKRKVFIRAIKNIEPGDEINYDYGTDYFKAYLKPIGCKCDACEKKRKKKRAEARAERLRLKAKRSRKSRTEGQKRGRGSRRPSAPRPRHAPKPKSKARQRSNSSPIASASSTARRRRRFASRPAAGRSSARLRTALQRRRSARRSRAEVDSNVQAGNHGCRRAAGRRDRRGFGRLPGVKPLDAGGDRGSCRGRGKTGLGVRPSCLKRRPCRCSGASR